MAQTPRTVLESLHADAGQGFPTLRFLGSRGTTQVDHVWHTKAYNTLSAIIAGYCAGILLGSG